MVVVWHNVSSGRIPEEFKHVIVCIQADGGDALVTKGFFDGTDWHSDVFDKFYTTNNITYWTPLPEPPNNAREMLNK